MSTKARASEADAVGAAYQLALAHIGSGTIDEVLGLWQELPVNATATQAEKWLSSAVRLILGRRAQSRELATSFYRLARALRTGHTVPHPGEREIPETVTFDQLRREFRLLVESSTTEAPQAGATRKLGYNKDAEFLATKGDVELPVSDDDDAIVEKELRRVLEEEAEEERLAEEQARTVLEALGPRRLTKNLTLIDKGEPAEKVDALREDARYKAGSGAAAAAARVVKEGARGTVFQAIQRDPRALGWARISDGDPCHFCAMLLSRGAVYKSKKVALYSDGDLYHDNCNCQAVPVFTQGQYDTSSEFAENRELEQAWEDVVTNGGFEDSRDGLSQEALNVWRRYINARRRAARSGGRTNETAQEASA